jgi:hypothetical protein
LLSCYSDVYDNCQGRHTLLNVITKQNKTKQKRLDEGVMQSQQQVQSLLKIYRTACQFGGLAVEPLVW